MQHNHKQCIDSAIKDAENICASQGANLTDIRKRVLRLVWQDHKAKKAYELLDLLDKENKTKGVKPPTVYRALDFLLEHGLVHKLESENAFIGCPHPEEEHQGQFLICDTCGEIEEVAFPNFEKQVRKVVAKHNATLLKPTLEIRVLCKECG
jgi:Fur family zinc uptake transcriptional regulator